MVVTIDGPAGAGKSTVARAVAERLGYRHVDTGEMYRELTAVALERGVDLDDAAALAALVGTPPAVAVDLRSEQISAHVSAVSRHRAGARADAGSASASWPGTPCSRAATPGRGSARTPRSRST